MSDWTIPPIEPYGQGVAGSRGQPAGWLFGIRLASWPQRALAGLIDYVAPIIVVPLIFERTLGFGESITNLALVAVLLANSVALQAATGQSFGKELVGLQLAWPIREEGDADPLLAKPPLLLVLGRLMAHAVDWPLTLGYGLLRPLRHPRRQTFADQITKTVVIADEDILLEEAGVAAKPLL